MASHNIAQNLRDNNTNWQNVKQAIEDKGVSTTGLTTAEYDDAIRQISGGSEPVLDSVNITPSTVSQTITPPTGTDGYNRINVGAVDNTIDANIVAGNIKNGVQILGITGNYSGQSGNYQSKTVTPAATEQIVAPDSGYDALSQVTVGAAPLQNKSISPSTSQQTVNADSPNYGLGTVTVAAVTAAIDANIVAGNIKKDIQILGVTGTLEGAAEYDFDDSALTAPASSVRKRCIFVYNNVIHMISNSNHYTYDVANDSWNLVDTNSNYLKTTNDLTTKEQYGVVVNDVLYWISYGASGWKVLSSYDLASGTITIGSNTISGLSTGFGNCICTDGKYIYELDYSNTKIDRINPATNTGEVLAITLLRKYFQMCMWKGKLYGIRGGKVDEIDLTNLTCTNIGQIVNNENANEQISLLPTDKYLFFVGGLNQENKVYCYDGTSISEYASLSLYSKAGCFTIYDGDIYEIGITTSGGENSYSNVFRKLGSGFKKELYLQSPTAGTQIDTGDVGRIIIV